MDFQSEEQIELQQSKQFQDISIESEQKKTSIHTNKKKGTKTFRFDVIVKFFNKISTLRGPKKGNYCRQFIKTVFKTNRQPGFVFSVVRLLLPSEDRDRGNYGLKQKGIAKAISDSLGLQKQDYQRLYHYKNPNYHQKGSAIGDFSLCVFQIAQNVSKQKSQITILELNILLDQLVLSNGNYITIFRQIFQKCNTQEIKWIIRIILKDLKLGLKTQSVLKAYHKDANDYFNITNNLMEVCKKFQNQSVSLDDQISLFNPIRPMLAGKKNINYFKHQDRQFYLQTKYDGQRIQVHYDGKQVQLFSRNAINYTHIYKQIVDYLQPNILCQACILDGEIIVLKKNNLSMVSFGLNKVVALSNNQSDMQLCYMIFDILWIKLQKQQMPLMKVPLHQRKKILSNSIRQVKGRIEVVEFKNVKLYDDILDQFSKSIQRNQEGIMLKNPQSLYKPKDRGTDWLKLKGDYIDGLTDTLDLLIIGGFFGDKSYRQGQSNHWIDKITTFALGVIAKDDQQEQQAVVYPFCKVGTGYDAQQLALLRQKLKQNLILDNGKSYPANLKSWKYSLQDKPDCWVRNLQKSIVLEVKAAQIIISDSYPTNFTLRFPRVIKIRYDKDWNEVLTLQQLLQMKNDAKYRKNMKRINRQSVSDNDKQGQEIEGQQNSKKIKRDKDEKKKGRLKNQLLQEFKCYELGQNDLMRSNLFYGLEFVVMQLTQSSVTRHQIERQILINGGKVSQNPLQKTHYVVADHVDFKLQLYSQFPHLHFVKPKYIYSCIRQQRILLVKPFYLIYVRKGQVQYYKQNFDKYSDSYTNYLNERQLNEILNQMDEIQYPINQSLIEAIGMEYRRKGLLSLCIGLRKIDEIKLKSHGNQIVASLQDMNEFQGKQLYSIIVQGQLKQYEKIQVDKYLYDHPQTILQFAQDLRRDYIL